MSNYWNELEEWMNLEYLGFGDYSVSNYGEIRNDRTGRILKQSQNQSRTRKIGMMPDRTNQQVTLSVAVIVANAFLQSPPNERFDTPINLDGDRSNNRADNLLWRPRWFAVKYHQQFYNGYRGLIVPTIEVYSGEIFETSWDAAVKYGLIDREIAISAANRTDIFPTGQRFEIL